MGHSIRKQSKCELSEYIDEIRQHNFAGRRKASLCTWWERKCYWWRFGFYGIETVLYRYDPPCNLYKQVSCVQLNINNFDQPTIQ